MEKANNMDRDIIQSSGTILYLSHGGGPLPVLGDDSHRELVDFFKHVPIYLGRPSAIIVFSAHWEENKPTITGASRTSLIYDYYGFSKESYEIKYPAAGNPKLADRLFNLLGSQGFSPVLDERRGFDHGVFIPLKIMYPQADIPCIQISLMRGLAPRDHIRMGRALAELMQEPILMLGSGFSFHNLRAFFAAPTVQSQAMNASFEKWLMDLLTDPSMSEDERAERLINWKQAPGAAFCHPREEHLMPLHVCYGAAGAAANRKFSFEVMEKKASAYLWHAT